MRGCIEAILAQMGVVVAALLVFKQLMMALMAFISKAKLFIISILCSWAATNKTSLFWKSCCRQRDSGELCVRHKIMQQSGTFLLWKQSLYPPTTASSPNMWAHKQVCTHRLLNGQGFEILAGALDYRIKEK